VALYRNAGGINKEEQDQIVNNNRGQAFLITGPTSRTLVQIETSEMIRNIFERKITIDEIRAMQGDGEVEEETDEPVEGTAEPAQPETKKSKKELKQDAKKGKKLESVNQKDIDSEMEKSEQLAQQLNKDDDGDDEVTEESAN